MTERVQSSKSEEQQAKAATARQAQESAPDRASGPSTPSQVFLSLQRSAGNRAVLAALSGQPKLNVGPAGDRYELEADQVATEVVARILAGATGASPGGSDGGDAPASGATGTFSSFAHRISRLAHGGQRAGNVRGSGAGEGTSEVIGPQGGELGAAAQAQLDDLRHGGDRLPDPTLTAMEKAFDADFGAVRVHRGEQAESLNRSMGAAAFTVGKDIFLGPSSPQLDSPGGAHLLAHELTHTIQQGAASPRRASAQRMSAQVQRANQPNPNSANQPNPNSQNTGGPTPSPDVEHALEAFAKADKGKIEAAANAYAKKKAEHEKVDIGKGVEASGSAEVAAQAGAWGGAEVVELENAYALLVEAGVVVGAGVKLEGALEKKFGPIKAKLSGSFQAFAGAMAKASGRLEVGAEGIAAVGEASAFAGAKSKQSGALEFSAGQLGAEISGEAEETVGASAKASGYFAFTPNEIGIGGEAEAFAGAKVEASATGKAKLYGRDAFKAKGKVEASVGAGGKVKGGFHFRRGVLHLDFEGAATAGFGFGGGAELEADFKPVAVYIWRQIDKAAWALNPGQAESVLKAPQGAKAELVSKLKTYSDFKVKQLQADKADNYVKIEKVQAFVGEVIPRKQVKGRPNASAIDAMIKSAIEDTLLPAKGKTKVTAKVTDGKVEDLKDLADPKELKGGVKSQKTGTALSSIIPYEDGD